MGFFDSILGLGGHQSKQSVEATTTIMGSAIQNVAQNCISYVDTQNQLVITGTGNIVGNINQEVSVSIDAGCAAATTQSADFQNKLQTSVTQLMEDSGVAMTQWMDGSKSDMESKIAQTVSTNVTSNTVQNCLNTINSKNVILVAGDSNVVDGVTQSSTADLISQCLLNNGQASTAINDVTLLADQHSISVSENPLQPFADAWVASAQAAMMMLAVVFVVVIAVVFIFIIPGGGGSSKSGGSSSKSGGDGKRGIATDPLRGDTSSSTVA